MNQDMNQNTNQDMNRQYYPAGYPDPEETEMLRQDLEKAEKTSGRLGLIMGLLVGCCIGLIIGVVYLNIKLTGANRTIQRLANSTVAGSHSNSEDSDTAKKIEKMEDIITSSFFLADVDAQTLENGAYAGMLDCLGDPYSVYYTPEELQSLYEDSEGVYYGIGAYVSMDSHTNYPMCSGVIAGTPAEEAGVRENDIFYKVDGVDTYGMTLSEVVALIKGEEHTFVNITFLRDGQELEMKIERRKVESPTVNYEMYDDGIAYIQITEFDTVTVNQFEKALEQAREDGMKGMVLDLRSNPGGYLSSVVSIAQMMLPKGLIVYTEDKAGERVEYSCNGRQELEVPLVVLVNGYSASASEILAGAIKDYELGTLLGTTTFGKGIVQRIIELDDGSAMKLTVSAYYTPNGYNIHGIGIEPDEILEFDGDRYYGEEKFDNQLERAKEILREEIGY